MPTQKESSKKSLTQKVPRSQTNYGLPRLTIAEAARILLISPEALTAWLATLLHTKVIGPSQWSKWTNDTEPISEPIIRLYLTSRGADSAAWQEQFRAMMDERGKRKTRVARPAIPEPQRKETRRAAATG